MPRFAANLSVLFPELPFLDRFEFVLQILHDREVLIHHEIEHGVEDEPRAPGEQVRRVLAAGTHIGIGG